MKTKSEKGGVTRYRVIPMTDELFEFIQTLHKDRVKTKSPSDLVFLGHQGRPIIKSRLSEVVTRFGKKVGIENAGLHIVRHTLLTDLSNENQSGSLIQKLAGHSSLVTTQKYLHPNSDDLRRSLEANEENNPLIKPSKKGKDGC